MKAHWHTTANAQLRAIREQHPVASRVLYALEHTRLQATHELQSHDIQERQQVQPGLATGKQPKVGLRTCSSNCPKSTASCRDGLPLTRVKKDTKSWP